MSKTIVIIDDDTGVCDAFTLALEDGGYKVVTANSGAEGVQKVADESPGLIFLDLKMPGMNGVEVLRKIRESGNETTIYIVTAFYQEYFDGLQVAVSEGLNFELAQKPLSGAQIRAIVAAVLG